MALTDNSFAAGPASVRSYYQYARTEMLPYVPPSVRRVLEVGCSAGLFGEQIKKASNAEVWGIETVVAAADLASKRLDKVLVCDVEHDDLGLPHEYFDCIVFNDVLEHLSDPWTVLRKMRAALAPSGCIVASIPNIRYYATLKELLLRKQWEYQDEGILDRTHLRFFTERTIPKFFSDCGYELLKFEGINPISMKWKLRVFYAIFGKIFGDTRYLQFACVARKI